MYKRRWKPSKSAARDFAETMTRIDEFCADNLIIQSQSSDSYYFTLDGVRYRVSNHSPESSPYHDGRDEDTVYIHASKTRIIDIYNDLKAGHALDGRGNRKEN